MIFIFGYAISLTDCVDINVVLKCLSSHFNNRTESYASISQLVNSWLIWVHQLKVDSLVNKKKKNLEKTDRLAKLCIGNRNSEDNLCTTYKRGFEVDSSQMCGVRWSGVFSLPKNGLPKYESWSRTTHIMSHSACLFIYMHKYEVVPCNQT